MPKRHLITQDCHPQLATGHIAQQMLAPQFRKLNTIKPVSYTHLDVYKRQEHRAKASREGAGALKNAHVRPRTAFVFGLV